MKFHLILVVACIINFVSSDVPTKKPLPSKDSTCFGENGNFRCQVQCLMDGFLDGGCNENNECKCDSSWDIPNEIHMGFCGDPESTEGKKNPFEDLCKSLCRFNPVYNIGYCNEDSLCMCKREMKEENNKDLETQNEKEIESTLEPPQKDKNADKEKPKKTTEELKEKNEESNNKKEMNYKQDFNEATLNKNYDDDSEDNSREGSESQTEDD